MKLFKTFKRLLLFSSVFALMSMGGKNCTGDSKQPAVTLSYTMSFSHIVTGPLTKNGVPTPMADSILTAPNLDSFLNSKNYDPTKVTIQSVKFSGADVRITSPANGNFNELGGFYAYMTTKVGQPGAAFTPSDLLISLQPVPQNVNEFNSGFVDRYKTELKGFMNKPVQIGVLGTLATNLPKQTISFSITFAVTVQPN